jgi:hypothetical protein
MILQAFRNVGDVLSVSAASVALISLYSNQLYPERKAAGSLGGAVNGGTVVLINGNYVRVR